VELLDLILVKRVATGLELELVLSPSWGLKSILECRLE
jgi:hypothetical protein